jgi:integrase
MNITDTWLKKMHGQDLEKAKTFNDDKRDGLAARISPKGKITFQYRYYYTDKITLKKKQQRIDLGSYPKTSIANARKEVDRMGELLGVGEDPRLVKHTEKINILERKTVQEIGEGWLASKRAIKRSSNNVQAKRWENLIYPSFGKVPFEHIPTDTWLKFIQDKADIHPEAARSALSELKQASKWAKKSGFIESLPLNEFGAADFGIERQKTTRTLEDWELSLVYQAIEHSCTYVKNKVMLRLALFFGCRIGELRLAEHSHFDLKERLWTVPKEISKTGKAIKRPIIDEIVPMIRYAMDISKSIKWLFPKIKGENAGEIHTTATFHTTIPGHLTDFINLKYLDGNPEKMTSWSVHDLRRTARTNWAKLGVNEGVSEKMLGHVLQGVLANYNHHDYLEEMKEAYRIWFYKLEKVQGRFNNVEPFVRPGLTG